MTQENDIAAIETKFFKALGSGTGATEHLATMIHSVVSSRDTTVLSRAINRAQSKGDTAAAGVVRFVVGEVWPGSKITMGKKKNMPTITIKGVEADKDALKRLDTAAEKKLSIRHATFRKTVKAPTAETDENPEWDIKAWADRVVKQHPEATGEMVKAAIDEAIKRAAVKAAAN